MEKFQIKETKKNEEGANMKRLENWCLVSINSPYDAPETIDLVLQGEVFNHPRFADGTQVHLSRIVGFKNEVIKTYSGSEYTLGNVNEEYEKKFPNAKARLFETLSEVYKNL